ncbi:MAG: glycosyltransferase, partial [bacterium]|nr:glycosyltransferase [bacterium]
PNIYKACTALVHLGSPAPWGNPLRSVLACGKAIVATDTSLSGLNVEAGRHVLKANTSDEFVAQISALLEQSTQRKEIERNARALAECFSWKETSQRYEEVYQKAAETTTALPHKLI